MAKPERGAATGLALLAAAAAALVCLCDPAAAALPRLEHPAKGDGSLSLLVVGDWGRKGACNQSRVAEQVNGIDFYINGHDHCLEHISSRDSPIQYFTSGGGSRAWRGFFQPNEDILKFFYDGQGFMSLQLHQDQADFIFYDVDGNILYQYSQWSLRKTDLPSSYVAEE